MGGNQQVYDFLLSIPADKLFAENVVIVFEVLARLSNKNGWTNEPLIEKIGWGFLKLDALGHTGGVKIDTATTAQNNDKDTKVSFGTTTIGRKSAVERAQAIAETGGFVRAEKAILPGSRFKGIVLQLYEHKYTAHLGGIAEDQLTPTVFFELKDSRLMKKKCMVVSVDVVPAFDPEHFRNAVRESKSAAAGMVTGLDKPMDIREAAGGGDAEEDANWKLLYHLCEVRKENRGHSHLP